MQTKSLAEIAYQELRKKVIFGEYLPGELLSENGLSKELEMSRTPIRDALHRLDLEGFIVTLKNRGIFVKEISYKEIFEIIEMNHCMTGYAVDLAVQGISTFNIKKLQMHLENQLKASEDDNYLEYIQQSILFGRCMIETTNNQVMLHTYDSLHDKTLRIAMVLWKLSPHEKHYSANEVNSEIYDAIASKKYEKIKIIQKVFYSNTVERFINKGTLS